MPTYDVEYRRGNDWDFVTVEAASPADAFRLADHEVRTLQRVPRYVRGDDLTCSACRRFVRSLDRDMRCDSCRRGAPRGTAYDRIVSEMLLSRMLQARISKPELARRCATSLPQIERNLRRPSRMPAGRLHQIEQILGLEPGRLRSDVEAVERNERSAA